jgi:hypothetical protein
MSVTFQNELTPASVWEMAGGGTIGDELLEWPPDVFALTDMILTRSEAHRFALSPPAGLSWPPDDISDWAGAVADAGRRWSAWVEDKDGAIPDLIATEWDVLRESAHLPLEHLTDASDWRACVALLTLHAIADEACAGAGVALTSSDRDGISYRARARELLARTGSLARVPTHDLRVLPKVRTAPHGTSSRVLSRYAGVHGPGVEARWHKGFTRRPGVDPQVQHANFLLLPWPLRVRASDFHPVEGSVRSLTSEPFGFFEFAPAEGLDLDLMDRTLLAARDEVDSVDVVVLPESAVDESEIEGLELLLAAHDVRGLIAGVRQRPQRPGQFARNWVHMSGWTGEEWLRVRQPKHHRWSLDESQIGQYHLGGSLHPHIRWWEAMEVPRRMVHFIEGGDGVTLAAVVCEDLAEIDEVADVLRSVGPTIVITPLLDGPQLGSRWAARYASVLADDPGSAVLTLTSYGMARRSRPRGRDIAPIVALWKDPVRGVREIPLESGAHGVLLTATADLAVRRSGDGRPPVENCTEFFDVGIYQVRASSTASPAPRHGPSAPTEPVLPAEERTILMSWAEAVAEAVAWAPQRVGAVLADAGLGAAWRAELAIPEPSPNLDRCLDLFDDAAGIASSAGGQPTLEGLIAALRGEAPGEHRLERFTRRVLRTALEQRETREAKRGALVLCGAMPPRDVVNEAPPETQSSRE